MSPASLVEQLTHARLAADLTQEQLARRIGSTQAHLSQVESGKADPRLSLIESYARAVGARLVWRVELATNEPGPEPQPINPERWI